MRKQIQKDKPCIILCTEALRIKFIGIQKTDSYQKLEVLGKERVDFHS